MHKFFLRSCKRVVACSGNRKIRAYGSLGRSHPGRERGERARRKPGIRTYKERRVKSRERQNNAKLWPPCSFEEKYSDKN